MSYYDPRNESTRRYTSADAYQQGYDDGYGYEPTYQQPTYQQQPQAPQPQQPPMIDLPKYAIGSILVTVVITLAAWLLTAVMNAIFRLSDAPAFAAAQRPFDITVIAVALLTLCGAGLLAMLIHTAPRPGMFFLLIAGLAGLIVTFGPVLMGTATWQTWVATGVINAMLSFLVPYLLLKVAKATTDPRRVQL
ncbi:hypothetical protein [Tsukamurella sp. 1534]|uniref:hypothetical protein n=1 Tax=Tsukamurella sp. 1534 TaxID=1151061 RepID=UPI0002F948C2|nr:hypothetical protein [Tsukamurella sp. 1534]